MPSAITQAIFGKHAGEKVFQYTVTNSQGLSFCCTNYGATILSVLAPDRHGVLEEVTLCYRSLDELKRKEGRPYYGCVAGRVANRIAKGRFNLDDVEYTLAVNNGQNHLHGGLEGFDQKIWKAVEVKGSDRLGLEFQYCSPNGEEGYPGNLMVSCSPILCAQPRTKNSFYKYYRYLFLISSPI
jgi:aldose 1-epimerase